ncbi:hypothetical protein HNQ51_002133 [Inhella inkyongensis]|uniref:Uncharacterized protein n=1 Tax=Inhella inkyongensis TaxID=392593 RepID=A0A840S8S9_9BURK|nr:hypothetical protein [Inhella inkyongensis]MBB5204819.1 hypothetical protein [Inhella inkyongensis]
MAGLSVLLSACGGGGGSSAPTPNPAPTPTPTPVASSACTSNSGIQLVQHAPSSAGRLGAVGILNCESSGSLKNLSWTQTEGPSVSITAHRSPMMAFEAPQSGHYGFSVSFTDANNQPQTRQVSLDVPAASAAPLVVARTSHSVRMGGKVSIRAWPAAGVSANNLRWTQIEGPTVTLDTQDPLVAYFTAPTVGQDTPIRLRVTAQVNGRSDSAEATVLVERHEQAPSTSKTHLWPKQHISRVYPYLANGPHAANLVPCVFDASQQEADLCTLSRLPLLAQETQGQLPTIDQVMNRVLVSHDWMGANFRRFLEAHDTHGDFRRMLMSTTAVVIGAQVRPSFYFGVTGAIHLDADNFWLTPEERDTINEAPDYRGAFGRELQYDMLWRYTKSNASIYSYYDPNQRVSRPIADLLAEAGPLMYHELAHALDFVPPATYGALNGSKTLWGTIEPRYNANQLVSDHAEGQYPLRSAEMKSLGQVKFQGVKATAAHNAYTPEQIISFFAPDLATDEYAYSSPNEDAAMTFEEVLLARRLGYRRDVAITPAIQASDTGRTIMVRWGQRGRIGDTRMHARARLILSEMAPWFDLTEIGLLPAPTPMRAGESWSANMVLDGEAMRKPFAAGGPLPTREELGLFRKEMKRQRHHLHEGRPERIAH